MGTPTKIAAGRLCTLAVAFVLVACSQNVGITPPPTSDSGASEAQAGFTQFPDLPMPTKGNFDMDRTIIFGGSESWFGRMAINTSYSPNEIFDFYREQLPKFGWQEISTLRSAISMMTYVRGDRVVSIQIQTRTIRGSEVLITVSPRGAPAQTGPTSTPPAGVPAVRPVR